MTIMTTKLFPAIRLLLLGACLLLPLQSATAGDFNDTIDAARGQTVYFNAWGGDDKINDYIAWAGDRLRERHGITLVHVKLADTAAAVGRILAEKSAGRTSGGSVDLLWVNGENFAAMKRHGLLQDDRAGRIGAGRHHPIQPGP